MVVINNFGAGKQTTTTQECLSNWYAGRMVGHLVIWGGCVGSGRFLFIQHNLRLLRYSILCGGRGGCLVASSCCQLSAKLLVTTLVGSFVVLTPRFWGSHYCWWSATPRLLALLAVNDPLVRPRSPVKCSVLAAQVVDSVISHLLQFLLFCLLCPAGWAGCGTDGLRRSLLAIYAYQARLAVWVHIR